MANGANQPSTPKDETPDTVTDDTVGGEQQSSSIEFKTSQDNKLENVGSEEGQSDTWKDDKRNAIFAKAREARKQQMRDYEGPLDPTALYGSETDTSELGDLEKQALEQQKRHRKKTIAAATGEAVEDDGEPAEQQQVQQQPRSLSGNNPDDLKRVYTVIVDGVAQQVTAEELLREHQMDKAAARRLEIANQLLASAKNVAKVQAGRQPSDTTDDQDGDFEDETGTTARRDANTTQAHPLFDARALAEKIQLGSLDEATEAMQQFLQAAASKATANLDPNQVLAVIEDRTSKEITQAYVAKQPDLQTDPHMLEITTKEIQKEMAKDLLKVMTIDDLRERVTSAQQLTDLHKAYRINRAPGFRGVEQLLKAGHEAARAWRNGGQPAPQQQTQPANQQRAMQDRQQRKASIPAQPAQRRTAPAAGTLAPSIEQSRSNAVARMRQARGQGG